MKKLLSAMEERGIVRVRLLVVDIHGHPRFMIIPWDYLEEAEAGIGIDGSSIPGFTTVDRSDLIAKPDLESVVFLKNEVALFCDVMYGDGQLFGGDPRGILKKVIKRGSKIGEFSSKPELEFYLLRGRNPLDEGGYMDSGAGLAIVREAVRELQVRIERIHHENGPGQYEIEPLTAPALKACDTIILLKEVLRKRAQKRQATATFMPKPLMGKAGSGMHFHILLEKNGENLFENPETTSHFIGGLLSHAKGISAICSPTINSYKRLVPHFEAPVHITWGRGNRSVLVRIPHGGKLRIEYRAPDPSCNPYLALALIIGAGLEGIDKRIQPPKEVVENVFESEGRMETLPISLKDALEEFEKDGLATEILGDHVAKEFVRLKKEEILSYTTHVSHWELDHYLDV